MEALIRCPSTQLRMPHQMADILIVDDDAVIAELIGEVLIDEGCAVRIAFNAASALCAIAEQPPALVLLDNMMPVMNGIDLLQHLRATGYAALPIVMMSAVSEGAEFITYGASAFLAKPFALDDLLYLIAKLVPLREQAVAAPTQLSTIEPRPPSFDQQQAPPLPA
jgi:CheY-like chemotaxis protein